MPPDRRPAPIDFSDPRGGTRVQAERLEDRFAGYAIAGDARSVTRPDAIGMARADVDPYPAASAVGYRPSRDIGNRSEADSRLGFSEPNGMRYAEAGANNRPSADSHLAPERARSLQPPQPAPAPPDRNLPRGENPPRVQAMAASPPEPNEGLCETAQILARVGSDIVLAGEIVPLIDKTMEENKDKIPERQWEATRKALVQQAIESRVQYKLICEDVKRSLPPEGLEHVEGLFGERFEEHEIPVRLKKANLASRLELERELEKIGSSLKREKRLYVERSMAMKWVDENVRNSEEITHDDMLDYYREHRKDFEHPGRARWEQLTIRFSRHPDKAEALDALARMGNEVLDGRPLADVAKEYSQGTTARDGGARDWTTQESLRSKELDRAIFALPLGKLSQIIEDEQGVHIIRVTEREDQSRTPFTEAQVEIKKKISLARREQQFGEFTERLKSEIPVWTVFDDQTADSRSAETGKAPIR
jgi:parvulin-like peptidyl-prolyl cis-trans isomerase-like protein